MNLPVEKLLDFTGRTVLVTGGSRGIGAAVSRRFAEAGADVCIHYGKGRERAGKLEAELSGFPGKIITCSAEMTDTAAIAGLFTFVREFFGRLDVLINNAGIYPLQTLEAMTETEWDRTLDINLKAPFLCTREAARLMKTNPGGAKAIINIGSIEGEDPAGAHSHYTAAKGGLAMFTRAAAKELGPAGIRVNTVSPGLIYQPGLEQAWPEGIESYQAGAPLGRVGTPEDIADACLFLASPGARWITGVNLRVDGGLLCSRGY